MSSLGRLPDSWFEEERPAVDILKRIKRDRK
jgi:hypothetical protein